MPSSYSTYSSSTSSSTTERVLWNSRDVLRIDDDCRCVGWILNRDRKCLNPLASGSLCKMEALMYKLSVEEPDTSNIVVRTRLQNLAGYALCVRNHQGQKRDMVNKWMERMRRRYPSGFAEGLRSRTSRSSSTASRQTVGNNSRQRSAPSPIMPAAVSREVEALLTAIRNAEQRLAELGHPVSSIINTPSSSTSPGLSQVLQRSPRATYPASSTTMSSPVSSVVYTPASSLSRVSTSDISSLHLSRTPSASSRSSETSRVSIASTRSAATASTATAANRCTRAHVPRRPLNEQCSICYEDRDMSTLRLSNLVWCKSSCGRSVHKECFNLWKAECQRDGRPVRCMMCRATWQRRCECDVLEPASQVEEDDENDSSESEDEVFEDSNDDENDSSESEDEVSEDSDDDDYDDSSH